MDNYTTLVYGGLDNISISTITFGGKKRTYGNRAKNGYRSKLINLKYSNDELDAIGIKNNVHFGYEHFNDGTKQHKIIRTKLAPKIDKRVSHLLKSSAKNLTEYMAKEYHIQEPVNTALIELISVLIDQHKKPIEIDGEIGFLLDKIGNKYLKIVPTSEKVPRTLKHLAKLLLDTLDEKKILKEPELINPEFPELSESLTNKINNWSQPDNDNQTEHIKALIDKEGSLIEYINSVEQYYIDVAKDIKTLTEIFGDQKSNHSQ